MYASFHSSVGIAIMFLPFPIEVNFALAVLSHPVVDMIGESSLGRNWIKKETILHFLLLLSALLGNWLMFVFLGIVAGNLIDIADKIVFKTLLNRFFDGNGWEPIHSWKFYPKILINLDSTETFIFNLLAVVLISCHMIGVY